MRSAVHASFGAPAQVLALHDSPVPVPAAGQVLVRTRLAPIHNHDLLTVSGDYGYRPELPAIGGSEAVGVIEALGAGVAGVAVGQRVAVAGVHGSWAEYFLAPAAAVVPMPDAIPDEMAAQLLAMPLSALMLLDLLQLAPGQWLVQNAANGAVGKTVAMLAKARGIRVLNLVRRDAGIEELAALGIGDVLSTASEDWLAQARQRMGGAIAGAAVDSIGGVASGRIASLLGEGGVLVSFGSLAGEALQISPADLIFKQITVKGFWASKIGAGMAPADMQRLVGELLQRTLAGELLLPVEAIHDLADIAQAAATALQPGRKGKVLLRP